MTGCLRTRVRKQPIIANYFESETVPRGLHLLSNSMDIWNCSRVRKQPIIANYFESETVPRGLHLLSNSVDIRNCSGDIGVALVSLTVT